MTKRFTFNYRDTEVGCDETFPTYEEIDATYEFDDAATWDAVLTKFVQFLGHAWGYDISDKVQFSTLQDKLQQLRDDGILWDDEEEWDLEEPYNKG